MRRNLVSLALVAAAASSHAVVVWDEGLDGDLSGDRLVPTTVDLGFGDNEVVGAVEPGDLDYLHIRLGPGEVLTDLRLTNYVSNDFAAFIAIQAGSVFTEPNSNPNVANLLGWYLFGPGDVGQNLLPAMGSNFGVIGFTPPLTGSDYTLWIQQTGDPTDYTFNFVVVPEPSTMALLAGGLALVARRRKRA